jgi:hypothetical protein
MSDSSINEYARARMKEVRPDLNVNPGSPLDVHLIPPIAALLPSLDEKLAEKYEITADDRANLLVTQRSEGEDSQVQVRLFFVSPIELNYGVDQIPMSDDSGADFNNEYAVVVTAAEMALYTYEDYYYTDITVHGETQFTSSSSLEWIDAPSEFSHLLVLSIPSTGALQEDDEALDARVTKEMSLRNVVTNPGAEAWFFDNYPDNMRDTLSVGFGDSKMQRNINTTVGAHLAGFMDVYTKEDIPTDLKLKDTIGLLTSREWERDISVAFMQEDAATGDMYEDTYHKNWISTYTPTVGNIVRHTAPVGGFTTPTDYSVDMVTGIITAVDWASGGEIMCDPDDTPFNTGAAAGDWTNDTLPRDVKINGTGFTNTGETGLATKATDILPGMFLVLSNGTDTETYLVISVNTGTSVVTLDRDAITAAGAASDVLWRREPVSINFKYNPMGVELEEFDNPLMWINSVTVLDPLTDEPLDPLTLIARKEGYGSGAYGAGPYGFGTSEGWILTPDDENYRYSVHETGVLEFQGNFLGDRIEISYKTSTRMAAFQAGMDANRSSGSDVLVKTFVPIGVTLTVDVTGGPGVTEITGLDAYIWDLAGTMELSDIVDKLYDLGATYVDLEDLSNQMTLEQWNIDGTFSNITIPSSGQINLSDPTTRFLPVSITVNVS